MVLCVIVTLVRTRIPFVLVLAMLIHSLLLLFVGDSLLPLLLLSHERGSDGWHSGVLVCEYDGWNGKWN